MIKKRGLVISILLAAVVVSAAGIGGTKYYKAKAKTNEITSFIDDVNKSRTAVRKTTTKIKPEDTNWLKDEKSPFTDKELDDMRDYMKKCANLYDNSIIKGNTEKCDANKQLTYKEAKEDVDRLFNLLKYIYGAYGYYGGDAKFNEAKQQILFSLPKDNKITAAELLKVLYSNLNFIKDRHFSLTINNMDYDEGGQYYYIADGIINKDSNGYYKKKSGEKYYIKAVSEDKNVNKYMHKTIDKEGKIAYNIVVMDSFTRNMQVSKTLTLKSDKGKESIESIVLKNASQYLPDYNKGYSYSVKDNIPVVQLSRFYNISQADKTAANFADSAIKIKKSPVAILDLRGNFGGYVDIVQKWMSAYFGDQNRQELIQRGATLNVQTSVVKSLDETSYTEEFREINGRESKTIKNKNTLFILMDKSSASASECLIEALSNVDNVVLVGTNTYGCLQCVNVNDYKLNNSGVNVHMGNTLYLTPEGDSFEGKGFEPDLLVNSKDALDSTLKMIKYYKLNSK